MKTLIKVSTVLAGVLAVATSQADQRAKVVDSSADFYTLRAIPAGQRQLSDDQLRAIEAGTINHPTRITSGNVLLARYHYTTNRK